MKEPNITCPICRFRHPASRTCAEAKRLADEAAKWRVSNEPSDSKTLIEALEEWDRWQERNDRNIPFDVILTKRGEAMEGIISAVRHAVHTAAQDAEDAAKWRALRNCARITAMGSAGLHDAEKLARPDAHVTLNFWTHNERETEAWPREWLDQFVAKARRV